MKEDILAIKSKSFAIKIVNLYKKLSNENKEYVLSKQLLRSGTSIGANIREAGFAQSQGDFISKLSIALKETNESLYWIEILHDTEFIDGLTSKELHCEAMEILRILQASIITAKSNKDRKISK
jgi:four helix bundle protein